ncbi:glycosyltransferase [Pseudoalteromonas byunsanensis]|nr:glycosyltransferase [Pseudoalteromonas byunsanensis]
MPTHNRLSDLKRAISSVLSQTYEHWELIIVDDGSKDGTHDYLQSLKNEKIRFFRHETPQGACASRNLAINNAKGEFITGLDDDDEFTPDRLSSFISAWQDKYSFLCTPVTVCKGNTKKDHLFFIGEINLQDLLVVNKVGNQIFCKTDELRSIGGFDKSFKAWQDYDTWVRFTARYGTGLKLPSSTYLQYENDASFSITRSPNRLIGFNQFVDKHRHLMNTSQIRAMQCWEKIIQGKWIPLRKLLLANKAILKYSILHNLKLIMGR